MKKNMIKAAVLLVTAALTIGSCKGPAGPMGPTGQTGAAGAQGEKGQDGSNGGGDGSIIINVPAGGGELSGLKKAVADAIADAKSKGGTNDGTTEAKKITVQVNSNFDIEEPLAMYYLYQAIEGLYVDLDLSQVKGTMFSYSSLAAGYKKDKIISVTLGSNVKTIAGGTISTYAFQGFTGMKSITANGVTTVGDWSFYNCTSLATVSFTAAQTIGQRAFDGCSLTTVSLPAAETIGYTAFYQCTSLVTVSLPAAQTIGVAPFSGCTSLVTVSLLAAQTIGDRAFYGCTSLATVTLGATAPTPLGTTIVSDIGASANIRTVTVKVPATTTDSAGYGSFSGGNTITVEASNSNSGNNWIDGLRGRGWNGITLGTTSSLNEYIKVVIDKSGA